MSLEAEPARPHDLAGSLDLIRRCELPDHGVAERFGHFFVVREDDGRIVGTGGLEVHGEYGLLRSVAVEPDYRGQGLGVRLLEAALERARQLELRSVYLLTTTARDFFARHRFAERSRDDAPDAIRGSWEFQTGCPTSAVLMQRRVSE